MGAKAGETRGACAARSERGRLSAHRRSHLQSRDPRRFRAARCADPRGSGSLALPEPGQAAGFAPGACRRRQRDSRRPRVVRERGRGGAQGARCRRDDPGRFGHGRRWGHDRSEPDRLYSSRSRNGTAGRGRADHALGCCRRAMATAFAGGGGCDRQRADGAFSITRATGMRSFPRMWAARLPSPAARTPASRAPSMRSPNATALRVPARPQAVRDW